MGNTRNDYEKHIEAFEKHFEAICGDDWKELSMREAVHLLAKQTLGLNGGSYDQMDDAAEKIGFDSHNIVHCNDGSFQVLAMVEFHGEETTAH
tara:strand:- start:238 stop:516 length:279 start_codon:yes stop_codon:yes gene_type:complete